jgi:hypothetical protein
MITGTTKNRKEEKEENQAYSGQYMVAERKKANKQPWLNYKKKKPSHLPFAKSSPFEPELPHG